MVRVIVIAIIFIVIAIVTVMVISNMVGMMKKINFSSLPLLPNPSFQILPNYQLSHSFQFNGIIPCPDWNLTEPN